jgi:ribosomal-protein-alanine N-acetyltransferase
MSGSTISFRLMQMEDIEQVVAIDQLSFSLPWPANSYRFELLENKTSRLWLAELQKNGSPAQIVAMIVVWLIVDEAHIATIAVHPQFRRLGIGRRLLAFSLNNAIQQGMHTVTLEVRAGNLAAQNLYRQFGFVIAGIRHRYYQDNQEDALIMTAKLDGLADRIHTVENTMILSEEADRES